MWRMVRRVFAALGAALTLVGLVGVPESVQQWGPVFASLDGDTARWVATAVGLVLIALWAVWHRIEARLDEIHRLVALRQASLDRYEQIYQKRERNMAYLTERVGQLEAELAEARGKDASGASERVQDGERE
jgi:hypothetical protein